MDQTDGKSIVPLVVEVREFADALVAAINSVSLR
jgi:hypothetical protein